jgi:alpha-N-arabinofuranosidase
MKVLSRVCSWFAFVVYSGRNGPIVARMTLRLFFSAYAALMVLGLSACGAKDAEAPEVAPHLSTDVVTCRVDPTKIIRSLPRTLFGTNIEWFNRANGLIAADGSLHPEWIELARQQGIDNVRFPGGTLSDFYHWRDGIGPVAKRPVREHPTDAGRSPNVFGTPEFLHFCHAIDARPLITVNAGTGDAAEAAAWVAYCNQPGNPDRKADGIDHPVDVKLWEIGNELYLPGNPTDKKIITVKPEVYAARFMEFATAMRAVDPTIKLIGIGTANPYAVPIPYPGWSEVLLKTAAAQLDYVAVHNAYFPMIFGQSGLKPKEVYRSLWAAPEAVGRSLKTLDAQIAKYEKGRRIEIAITEWGALFSGEKRWIDHVKTMGSAVYLARLMQVFMEEPRVTLTDYFKFTDRFIMGWVGYDRKPKAPFYVIELFSRHFGTHLVSASTDSPTFSVPAIGVASAESNVPEVTSIASTGDGGKKLFVNFVNRSWDTIYPVKLDLGSFPAADSATVWELSSPGVTDHNGRDLPEEIPGGLAEDPPLSRGAKLKISIETKTIDLKSPVLLPPHSILTIELTARS